MQNLPVNSRIVKEVYFSQDDGELRIRFHSGDERRFTGVPKKEAIAMCESGSPGNYYIAHIRRRFTALAA
ncbi:KTSC domain-containing protein [Agrobacterium cavarae]|uniref:KTSC domain-containing protein n=1 Tax=Agrobacterium cavarae TaxID=2528239 RepID=UPI000DDD58E6|nr:KTSC domain-containing protein [Agrobacterium cavarae]